MSSKIQNFFNSLQTLEQVPLQDYKNNNILLSGCVNTFNLTFELSCKAMKWILQQEGVSSARTGSPKLVLELAYERRLIDDQKVWIHLLRLRNDESHHYNKASAIALCEEITSIIPVFQKLKQTILDNGYSLEVE